MLFDWLSTARIQWHQNVLLFCRFVSWIFVESFWTVWNKIDSAYFGCLILILLRSVILWLFLGLYTYGSVSKVAVEIVTLCTFSDNSKNPSWSSMKFGHMVENNFYGISEKFDLCPITDRNYFRQFSEAYKQWTYVYYWASQTILTSACVLKMSDFEVLT